MTTARPSATSKSVALIALSLLFWIGLVVAILGPWVRQIDLQDMAFSILAHINAGVWWIILLWALHHLSYQIVALFQKNNPQNITISRKHPTVAVLYLTCDDFNANCAASCLNQTYKPLQFYICDDSAQEKSRLEIDRFCAQYPKAILVRRENRVGFKAGNINHAIRNINAEWILLVDADQTLPENYLSDLILHVPENAGSLAFIQAAHKTADLPANSLFQQALSSEVEFFYSRDLSARTKFGFVPLLGHGVLVNKTVLEAVGGIPELVSEDFAFAIRCLNKGYRGQYLEFVGSEEVYPFDFGGFLLRLRKFSGGTAELFRHELIHLLAGKGYFTEKWDMLLMLIWYILMPLLVVNGFLGSFVVHRLWSGNISYLHPALPYLYLWMFAASISLIVSSTRSLSKAVRFYFWSTAIYTASLPLASLSFLAGLLIKPIFKRTPKNAEDTKLHFVDSILMVLLGLLALFCSYIWLSPFSPILAGQGVAYLCFPLYNYLNSNSAWGKFARLVVVIPGLLMIFALYAMWQWGRF